MAMEMKNSGVEWLGEIPSHWNVNLAFQIFEQVKNKNEGLSEKNLLSLSYGKIKRKNIDGNGGLLPESFDGYNIIEADDIVLRLTDLQNDHTSLRVGIVPERGIITSAYLTLRNQSDSLPLFLYYYLHTFDICKGFYGMGAGVRQGLNWEGLKLLKIVLPPADEQRKIVDFLDHTCSKVDAVIEKTKSTINEYKSLKKSVICNSITKGISGKSNIIDSGVEWIGEIAKTHSLKKLKYVCQILDQFRKPITADLRSQEGEILYDYYGASGAIDKIDDFTIDDHVMLIGEDGANLRMRNLPLMYEINGKAWVNNHAHILKPNEDTDFYYLFYALEGLDINPYITGSAQPKLSQDNLKNILIPMPSYEEQCEISAYLITKCSEIDALIAQKTALLEEMENYKKSVIYEYVTGKKQVQ